MAPPVYLWLEDEEGKLIKGGVDLPGMEGSIEVNEIMYSVEQSANWMNGDITAKRIYSSFAFMKSIDGVTPYLYKALSSGKTFKKAVFKFYRINYSGQEEEYFRTTLENVKITEVEPFMMNINNARWVRSDHLEYIDLAFEKITWHYLDGNIIYSDSWKGRTA
ncbi:type VI secretion system tube protein Hcp [Candidatus Pantoea deserta]|uniref:Type VI secretion system tube protein Hcp n=1 Tax=Candidatus Pantoea deserta TaxID=1869313 RepID=A0A3N4NSR0_9GAMM|nr:type VI secretion system tube protein TssD [Pantoea deserta]RPD96116.1 type VI secretion system tube protein Hcp [Pantoea deserta]